METSENSSGHTVTNEQKEFARRHNASPIATLVTRVWQSDLLDPWKVQSVLNAWFGIAEENPTILVVKWQVLEWTSIVKVTIIVEVQLPTSEESIVYEVDPPTSSAVGR